MAAIPNTNEGLKIESVTPWSHEMDPSDFISYSPGFDSGIYWDEFDVCTYPCKETGDITYYVYDPIRHGASPDKKYPALMWIHGFSCGLDGIKCIGYSGGEQFVKKEYQEQMGGGAYIIVPCANEKRTGENTIENSWGDNYIAPIKEVFEEVYMKNQANISARFIMGGSSGGYFSWREIEEYPEFYQGAIPISSGYVPSDDSLDRIEKHNIHLIIAHGRRDELTNFDESIAPRETRLQSLRNTICFFPEWVRNFDKGVASINLGFEMGQHCLINQFQANLLYSDGSYYDERLSKGVTGWIKEVSEQYQ